jgi:hypothetical protein
MSFVPVICLEQRGRTLEIEPGQYDGELDEGPVLLTFQAFTRPIIELDDKLLVVSWRSRELVAAANFDLTNQVGYHRLRVRLGVRIYDFDFHTSTAKATRDEVLRMAQVCGQHYLGFRRQFSYAAANGELRKVLLPQIHFAWLRDRMTEINELARSINARPSMTLAQRLRPSTRAKSMSLPATIRLLHERPHLLEEREDGPVVLGDKRYWPALVMEKVKNSEPAAREHAAIAHFVEQLFVGCRNLRDQVDRRLRDDVDNLARTLLEILVLPVLAKARRGAVATPPPLATPTQIERTDGRYARMRSLRSEYLSDIGPSDDYDRSIRANVKDIWEIYQTFVAHVLGNALDLAYCSANQDLRGRDPDGASMRSVNWAFGFDTKPPGTLLTSWRERTVRAADERPDISLVGATLERSILFDAKFRVAKVSTRARQEDLFEMQGYLNSFSIPRGGIIFPGSEPTATMIGWSRNRLVELPMRAEFFTLLGGKAGVHDYVRTAIDLALKPLES